MIETLPPQPAACLVPSSTSFFLSAPATPSNAMPSVSLHGQPITCAAAKLFAPPGCDVCRASSTARRGAGVARVISRAKQQGFSAVQPFLVRKRVSIGEVGTKKPPLPPPHLRGGREAVGGDLRRICAADDRAASRCGRRMAQGSAFAVEPGGAAVELPSPFGNGMPAEKQPESPPARRPERGGRRAAAAVRRLLRPQLGPCLGGSSGMAVIVRSWASSGAAIG